MKVKTKTDRLKTKEKIALAVFLEATPKLIERWKQANTNLTFDAWLMEIYSHHQEQAKK